MSEVPPAYTTAQAAQPEPTTTTTSASAQPPEYPSLNDPPPSYAFPQTFAIGSTRTNAPLVTSDQVKGHLTLLHAFATLKAQVEALGAGAKEEIPTMPDDKERRWAWFVGLAVERFERWCDSFGIGDTEKSAKEFLPPLDVLMVWHAYMLNPGWYAEDCTRVPALRHLGQISPILSISLSSPGLEAILFSDPAKARLESWLSRTDTLFDPLEDAQRNTTREIRCPKCRSSIKIFHMNTEGSGYLQQNFSVECPKASCKALPKITKTMLGMRKLAEDLARPSGTDQYRWSLAGTLRTAQTAADLARGKIVKDAVLSGARFKQPADATQEEWTVSIMEKNGYDAEQVYSAMALKMRAKGGNLCVICVCWVVWGRLIGKGLDRIKRIFSAYADGGMFSVDLVIRQGSFVTKMHDLHWTEPNFFDTKEDEVALQHAIARYHAFLDLITTSSVSFHVPTLDIDLAWHTHQLMGERYNTDCKTYVGRYIDHDDKVEEQTLASAFDITCRAWKDRFDLPYTHCGCPLPGQTIGQRLSRLVVSYTQKPSYLVPPPREDLLAGTHPSDHNAVFLFHRKHAGEAAQQRRREKFKKRQEREAQEAAKAAKGKGKGKVRSGEKGEKAGMTAEERRRADERAYGHDPAFLVPVPLYYGYGYGLGCAAYAGNVVYASNGGGIGGCAAVRVRFWTCGLFG
ncbi:hypothetical protein FPV67DRAFT_440215 [Lyophyllum atratum]|nr:hypothetical protein FPV67DRAFT_440215 [Lyophyllum atratum]